MDLFVAMDVVIVFLEDGVTKSGIGGMSGLATTAGAGATLLSSTHFSIGPSRNILIFI